MGDLAMVLTMIVVVAVCVAYADWIDRLLRSGDDGGGAEESEPDRDGDPVRPMDRVSA
jgi:hypothetical protein